MEKRRCPNEAEYRYTWPGRDETFVCAEHAAQVRRVVEALGRHLQIIPLVPGGPGWESQCEIEEPS